MTEYNEKHLRFAQCLENKRKTSDMDYLFGYVYCVGMTNTIVMYFKWIFVRILHVPADDRVSCKLQN